AEKVYQQLNIVLRGEVALLNPVFFESTGFKNIEDFKQDESMRVLIIANEAGGVSALHDIPFLIHFELPEEKETFISRMVKSEEREDEVIAITFSTDLELSTVRKIEQALGQKLSVADLPDDLI